MSAPRLEACYFNPPGCHYDRLARVLEHSARARCPGWSVNVRQIATPALHDAGGANKRKLDEWTALVATAADGERLLLIDADTMILRPLDDVWAQGFDVAYTTKPGDRLRPFNAGVVFVRVTAQARAFMAAWRDENTRLYLDRRARAEWAAKYAGHNQAALGSLLERGVPAALGVQLQQLPCVEWNCEDASWEKFDAGVTRIVHLKSGLRLAALGLGANMPRHRPLVRIWRDLERECQPCQPPSSPAPEPVVAGRAPAPSRPLERQWYTTEDVAAELHVKRITAWRLLRPYRSRCHTGRKGRHPRRVLWVPAAVVRELLASRETVSSGFHNSLSQ